MNLTDYQVEQWRKVLFGTVGMYAFIMPRAEIEKVAARAQALVNQQANDKMTREHFVDRDREDDSHVVAS